MRALRSIVAVLAALLAGLSLVPKAKNYAGIVAVIAVLGALLAITETINLPAGVAIGWAMWPLVACSVLQAIAAAVVVLLDAGVDHGADAAAEVRPLRPVRRNTGNTGSTASSPTTVSRAASSSRRSTPGTGRSTADIRPARPRPKARFRPAVSAPSPRSSPGPSRRRSRVRPPRPPASPASARHPRPVRAPRVRRITPTMPGVSSPTGRSSSRLRRRLVQRRSDRALSRLVGRCAKGDAGGGQPASGRSPGA